MSEDTPSLPEDRGVDRAPTIEALAAQGDFWIMLKAAVAEGGGDPEGWAWGELDMATFANVYAPLGLRIVRIPEKAVDVWPQTRLDARA